MRMSQLLGRMLLAFGLYLAICVQATAQETDYNGQTETKYNPATKTASPTPTIPAGVSTETTYNPGGTWSSSKTGLISTRRDTPEFPAFLVGMQDASLRRFGSALNVATDEAGTLGEQAEQLSKRGVTTLIVDAPDPDEAKEFMERARLLGRSAVLVSEELPRGYHPPVVVHSPILLGERIGEEAIRLVGNVDVEIAYVIGEDMEGRDRERLLQTFRKPFGNVAPKIQLKEIDPMTYTPGMIPPAVVCVLTGELSGKFAPVLQQKFPETRIVVAGEHPNTVAAMEEGLVDIRLRPDYDRLLVQAIQESRKKSDLPIILQAVAEKKLREF